MSPDIEQKNSILAALFDQSADLVVQTNIRSEIIYASPAARRYGYDPLEVVGTSGLQLLHPKDRANAAKNSVDVLAGVVSHAAKREHRLLRRGGGYAWVEGNPVVQRDADGRITGFVNVFRDITERRKAEANALRQTALLEKVFESSPTAKLIMTLKGDIVTGNPAFLSFINLSAQELVGKPALDFIDRDYANWDPGETRLLRAGALDAVRRDFRFLKGDGAHAIGDAIVSIVRGAGGRPWRLVAQIVDVTELRRLQADIAARDAQFRLVAENTRDIIVYSDMGGRITYVSPSIRDLGFEPAELFGKSFVRHIHPDDRVAGKKALDNLASTGAGAQFRWRARHAQTGAWVWVESSLVPILNPVTGQRDGILDVVRNIDAQVAQEIALNGALSESERLSSVKTEFLSNMNHELRTPITTILGISELLMKRVPEFGSESDYLSRIQRAGSELLYIAENVAYLSGHNGFTRKKRIRKY